MRDRVWVARLGRWFPATPPMVAARRRADLRAWRCGTRRGRVVARWQAAMRRAP